VNRSLDERLSSVRRLLAAAARVYARRDALAADIAESTGLSPEGVKLGFDYLERGASDADLATFVSMATETKHVHVILSANVFVAPLRALALAIAAAPKVTVRPSPRDPCLTLALIDELSESAVEITEERDPAAIDAGSIHVYGRESTIDAVRTKARPGTAVRAHGPGLGVVILSRAAKPDSAAALMATDVVAFDQRGCLSPRVVFVEGDTARGTRVAEALHRELGGWALRVPRGRLDPDERSESRRWIDTVSFAGHTWEGPDHVVGLGAPLLPPSGRHVQIVPVDTLEDIAAHVAPIGPFVVTVGTDDPERMQRLVPAHSRVSALGHMQRPSFDGPVDRR
jgi:hypothetical protein